MMLEGSDEKVIDTVILEEDRKDIDVKNCNEQGCGTFVFAVVVKKRGLINMKRYGKQGCVTTAYKGKIKVAIG